MISTGWTSAGACMARTVRQTALPQRKARRRALASRSGTADGRDSLTDTGLHRKSGRRGRWHRTWYGGGSYPGRAGSGRFLRLARRRLVLPAPVQPEVLLRVASNQALEGGRETLGDRPHGVGLAGVLLRPDQVLGHDLVAHRFAHLRSADDQQRHVVLQGQKGDR